MNCMELSKLSDEELKVLVHRCPRCRPSMIVIWMTGEEFPQCVWNALDREFEIDDSKVLRMSDKNSNNYLFLNIEKSSSTDDNKKKKMNFKKNFLSRDFFDSSHDDKEIFERKNNEFELNLGNNGLSNSLNCYMDNKGFGKNFNLHMFGEDMDERKGNDLKDPSYNNIYNINDENIQDKEQKKRNKDNKGSISMKKNKLISCFRERNKDDNCEKIKKIYDSKE